MTDDYHDDFDSVSKTMLTLFCHSRKDYELTYIKRIMKPKQPTSPMIVGTVLHGVLLEGKKAEDFYQVYPESVLSKNGAASTKAAKEFAANLPAGVKALKEKEAEGLDYAIKAVRHSLIADVIEQATGLERAFYADLYGLPCRCKPDIYCDMGDRVTVWDLKFCDPSPGHFNRWAGNFYYDLQDSHYSAILSQHFGKPVDFKFFAFEPEFPYKHNFYWYEPREREIAADFHRTKIAELRKCMATGNWKDNWPNAIRLPFSRGELMDFDAVDVGEAEVV